jgi:glycosyltransferase involved in cell wall biosynthesis
MMTLNRLYEVVQCIKRVQPYVDRVVIIDGGSIDDTILTLRNWKGVELYLHHWKDNFSEQRTNYLNHAGENGGTDWCLISDPDELFAEVTLQNMRNSIDMIGKRYNMIAFESHSVMARGDKVITEGSDKYWKPLLFKWNPGIHYVGNPHETLIIDGGPRIYESKYHYYHIKQDKMNWPRGQRNAFIGGGGPNLGEKQKLWKPFRALVKEITGIDDWNSFNQYMVNGNIDKRIKDEFIKFRLITGKDGDSEWREMYKNYFRILHPEEEPVELRGEYIE